MSKPEEIQKEYEYFDTPDGEDIDKKLWCVIKGSSVVAFGMATVDVMLNTQKRNYLHILGRYTYICVPIVTMSAAFVMVTNSAARIRQKDDKWNWALGATTAGGVFGAWRKSAQLGFAACALFTAAALVKKDSKQNNYLLMGTKTCAKYGTARSVNNDYTLTAHRPGNYTTQKLTCD